MPSGGGSEPSTPSERNPEGLRPGARLALRVLAILPLWMVQVLGAGLGRALLDRSKREGQRLHENLRAAGYEQPQLRAAAAAEAGKTLLELFWLWQKPQRELVRSVDGEEWVAQAQAQGRPIIFLTPHLGCFELAAQYAASHAPITVMYRPPKQRVVRLLAGRHAY